ncbi:membrane protein [Neptunitalea chrysea]|uniref:Membrane protein n=1 Tax=Neptunitalea chrysea TaxID=1647581 RepID=A0A9W6B591_9FLAO|nr:VIT family protein [Neptunitalea chrysea]GLB52112.1 membrane protein [Neptunitalea chrysea]
MEKNIEPDLEEYYKVHYIHKSNWLRAAVLGANDGILSTASIAVGVAAATTDRISIILATLAGLVAGALSMAAGEYVSVSSQTDIEKSDIEREKKELEEMPELELKLLAKIYETRGLSKNTALQVATELTEHNALEAHVRDELGINEMTKANPLQAALASGASFTCGALMPLLVTIFLPVNHMVVSQYVSAIFFLMLLGAISAKTGGANITKAVIRITVWGTIAMFLSAFAGHLFNMAI